jgi:hypothetical protein
MTSNPPDYSSKRWRERAKELREHASTMKDPELRREVEIIADMYERLAEREAKSEEAKEDGARWKRGPPKPGPFRRRSLKLRSRINFARE